jgi:hypothetical protein
MSGSIRTRTRGRCTNAHVVVLWKTRSIVHPLLMKLNFTVNVIRGRHHDHPDLQVMIQFNITVTIVIVIVIAILMI